MSEHIPLLDLTAEVELLWPQLVEAVERVLRGTQFIMGAEVEAFEEEVANYLNVPHAVSVNSGTDALVIALDALGVVPGDEVITTAYSFAATAEAIHRVGAQPVFVDIDPKTFNIDAGQVADAVTKRTKVVLPVHLFGRLADMDSLTDVAEAHGLRVVEDAAQAFGAGPPNARAGTIGHVGAFSFFPSKPLGGFGDGGLLATSDSDVAERARMLRVHGSRVKYRPELVGYNSRLDEMQAALLRVKLPYVDDWNDARRLLAFRYQERLGSIDGLVTPDDPGREMHVFHAYTIRTKRQVRDELQASLHESGIHTAVYFPVPLHRLPMYPADHRQLPEAERASTEVLSLPLGPLMQETTQDRVIAAVLKVLG